MGQSCITCTITDRPRVAALQVTWSPEPLIFVSFTMIIIGTFGSMATTDGCRMQSKARDFGGAADDAARYHLGGASSLLYITAHGYWHYFAMLPSSQFTTAQACPMVCLAKCCWHIFIVQVGFVGFAVNLAILGCRGTWALMEAQGSFAMTIVGSIANVNAILWKPILGFHCGHLFIIAKQCSMSASMPT